MIEYVTGGLVVAVVGLLGWVYRRGKASGMDDACEEAIKHDISMVRSDIVDLKSEIKESVDHGDSVHNELFGKVNEANSKIDEVRGSVKIIEKLVVKHFSKESN